MSDKDIEYILSVGQKVGGRWKMEILYALREKPLRWSELSELLPDAAPNCLTRQLRALEDSGLLTRTVASAQPPQIVQYSLTPSGQTLVPWLEKMAAWSEKSSPAAAI